MAGILLEQASLGPRILKAYNEFCKKPNEMNVSSCNQRLKTLKKNWDKYESNHYALFGLQNFEELKSQPYFEEQHFEKTESEYLIIIGKFQLYLDSNSVPTNDTTHVNQTALNTGQHFHNTEDSDRLPRLGLTVFDGSFKNWESFRDIFTSTVINKPNTTNISKFRHLMTCLKGDALNLINSYPVTNASFTDVWQKLIDRYDVKKRLVSAHVASIYSLKPITVQSASELKRILDGVNTPLSSLKLLGRPVNQWDDLLNFFIFSLLDIETKRQWEIYLNNPQNWPTPAGNSTPTTAAPAVAKHNSEPPTFQQLIEFLESQICILESLEECHGLTFSNQPSTSKHIQNPNVSTAPAKIFHTQTVNAKEKVIPTCIICNNSHYFSQCPIYLKKNHDQRIEFVKANKRCFNCLAKHFIGNCPSKRTCNTCHKKHHTTLHILKPENKQSTQIPQTVNTTNTEVSSHLIQSASLEQQPPSINFCGLPNQVLLSTAIVRLVNEDGSECFARALVDQGSQASFISESLFKRLNVRYSPVKLPISGVGCKNSFVCKKSVEFILKPHFYSDFSLDMNAYVIPKITSYSPTANKSSQSLVHFQGIVLADPDYFKKGQIEILLGASVHACIIEGEIRRGNLGEPIAMNSKLGWIISGNSGIGSTCCFSVIDDSKFIFDLERFWRQEEMLNSSDTLLTPEEQDCENYFLTTHSRNSEGRYVVKLPFKSNILKKDLKFPGSFSKAKNVLLTMENKFSKNEHFENLYVNFMIDYRDTGHMRPTVSVIDLDSYYFCPHHGVLKKFTIEPKLRTVFNFSAEDLLGISINDLLHAGANLLPDISELLVNWMKYRFVFVSDVTQMFRQILVHEDDYKYQQILWRFTPQDEISLWTLLTVTYGMVSSPFLAIRVCRQLALDEGVRFPLGAEILSKETYMDDTLSGGHSLEEAVKKQSELINICKVGGFSLHKWMANDKELLNKFPEDIRADCDSTHSYFSLLGLHWNPSEDVFSFNIVIDQFKNSLSKRQVLSRIAKLYDPLGWISPVVIVAKAFIQKLWLAKVDWDDKLPDELRSEFLAWYNQLPVLNTIRIQRWSGFTLESKIEIYGFADASKLAYAACVYFKITKGDNTIVKLIQAKSKVAPMKPLLTIPKLELNAACLLAKLVVKVSKALNLSKVNIFLYTDSTDVLYWLKDHPSKWPMFIAHRCSKIHSLLPDAYWSHVRTHENPADCISRGLFPEQLPFFSLWWEGGPVIKRIDSDNSKMFQSKSINVINCCVNTVVRPIKVWDLLDRYSNTKILFRITALILRFIYNIFKKLKSNRLTKSKLFSNNWFKCVECNPICSSASVSELYRARLTWVYLIQREFYKKEISSLENKVELLNSNILSLDPFLEQNLLRLGGRIQNSLLSYDQKHPYILPGDNKLSKLIVIYFHLRKLHGGISLTLASLRQEYWIVNGRALVKRIIHRCHSCTRYRASFCNQKMGNLPPFRVQMPDKPFRVTGVDYAGPYSILRFKGRGSRCDKGYISLFVCMATRAVHIELVTGYSSQDFIAALRRFTSVRGPCSKLVSDKGTNFVGADRMLQQMYMEHSSHMQKLDNFLVDEGIVWSFNSPGAPHCGGLWEAAVKSVKFHIKRVVGEHKLTFEEFYTLLKQIESCLNSRPLLPLTDDTTDRLILCPAMILHNSTSYIIPESDYTKDKIPPIQRYIKIQSFVQDWWKIWSLEYLQTVQLRHKWKRAKRNLEIDDMVLISDETLSPARWPLGRIVDIHDGVDGLTRIVSVKTSHSVIKRPIHKLILLDMSPDI